MRGKFSPEVASLQLSQRRVGSMRRLMIFGLAVVLMAGLAALTIPRAGADSEEAKLRTRVPKIIGTWESLDINKVEPYYPEDAGCGYFHIVPRKYNHRA